MSNRQAPGLSTEDAGPGYRRGSGSTRSSRGGSKSSNGGSRLGSNLIMALLLAGLVLAGWFIANQQQTIAEEQARMETANKRLELLEERLIATDSAMSQEGQDTKSQINLWESEIRKLWAVSNERNKKWIKTNESNIASVKKSLNGIEASTRDIKAAVGRHESAFDKQQALVDQLTSLELQMQQVIRGQRDLVDKVNSANQSVASLRANLAGKVNDNAEAVASMDAFRVAINSRLSELERRLNASLGMSGG